MFKLIRNTKLLSSSPSTLLPVNTGVAFFKVGRRTAHDLSIVNVATKITVDNGICTKIRIAVGSVAPTPIRVKYAEEFKIIILDHHQLETGKETLFVHVFEDVILSYR